MDGTINANAAGLTHTEQPGFHARRQESDQAARDPRAGAAPSIKSRAIRGSALTMAGYGFGQILRLGGNAALAWLLFPEAFGLMALITVVQGGLTMFSDIGIGPSVVQHQRGQERAFLNTAWTIQIVRGIALWICACLLAWPMAWIFARNDPLAWSLLYLLPVAATTSIITGFRSPSVFTLSREMRFGGIIALEVAEKVVTVAVMVVWAVIHPSVWALVVGTVAGKFIALVVSHFLDPNIRVRFQWDRECARELIHFGKWIFLSTAITFFAMKADRIMLGNLVPLHLLGVYSFGLMVAMLPQDILSRLQGGVLFPALAEQHRRGNKTFGEKVIEARRYMLVPAMFLVLGAIVCAPPFFAIVYDDRYLDAGWMAQLIGIGVWFAILQQMSTKALLASGRSKSLPAGNLVNLAVTVTGCLIGHALYGMPGFILGFAAGNVAGLLVMQWAMHRAGLAVFMDDLRYTTFFLFIIGLGAGLPILLGRWMNAPILPQVVCVTASLCVAGVWTYATLKPLFVRR